MLHVFMYGGSLLEEPLRRPLHHRAMLWTKVFGNGSVAVVMAVAGMMGYDVVVVADLHVGHRIGQLYFLADVGVWTAVVVDVFV